VSLGAGPQPPDPLRRPRLRAAARIPLRKKSFSVSFAARDPQGQETFVPLLSDGDLAAAFACARPALRLRLDVRSSAESEREER